MLSFFFKYFKEFDNGNGRLSLAEIDRGIKYFHPELGTNKKAMMRAYKAVDKSGVRQLQSFSSTIES